MKEYVIWGIPQGGYTEEILVQSIHHKPITSFEKAEHYANICRDKLKVTDVRIQEIDFATGLKLDFINSINL